MEFVNENERVVSAYRAGGINYTSSLGHAVPPTPDQQNLGEGSSLDQGAFYPLSPNPKEPSSASLSNSDRPLEDAVLCDPSLAATFDESGDLHQMQPTPLDRSHRDTTPELKFQTFRKKPQFDTFRPRPRSHFSSDAVSVWPLRSIEESRLLQHFIQNLAPWVRLRSHSPAVHIAKTLPSSMLAIAGDTLRKLRRACAPPVLYS